MYRPRDFGMGDFWFLEGPDALHIYYLEFADEPVGEFREVGIGHATSTDGVHWTEQGRILSRGQPGAFDDAALFTGSAITVGGRHYMLYTGLTSNDRVQRTGLLISEDMYTWRRHEANPVLEPDARWYETAADVGPDTWVAWRDPYLWQSEAEGVCYALITATERGDAPRHERGCIGLARSEDMLHWQACPPVATPGLYHDHEVPDLAHINDRWYLLHSTRLWRYSKEARARKPARWCRNGTHYLISDLLGNWEVPPIDVVAGSMTDPHYAARAQRIGDDLLLYSWGPVRRELALPMKLEAAQDGSLCALYWSGLDAFRGDSLCEPEFHGLKGAWQQAGGVLIAAVDGEEAIAGCERVARDLCFTATVVPDSEARAGIGVEHDLETIAGMVDLQTQEALIGALPSGEILASVPWDVSPVTPISIRLVADGDVISLYIDDQFAVSAWVEERKPGAIRLAVAEGSAEFSGIEAYELNL